MICTFLKLLFSNLLSFHAQSRTTFNPVVVHNTEKTPEMKLEDLGYNTSLDKIRKEQNNNSFDVGRVILEHKDRYVVKTENTEFEAELIGNLRY